MYFKTGVEILKFELVDEIYFLNNFNNISLIIATKLLHFSEKMGRMGKNYKDYIKYLLFCYFQIEKEFLLNFNC